MDEPLRMRGGRVLTDADVEALADEAEAGYDVSALVRAEEERRASQPARERIGPAVALLGAVRSELDGPGRPDARIASAKAVLTKLWVELVHIENELVAPEADEAEEAKVR